VNTLTWHVARWWVWLRRGRMPALGLPDPAWYFAYGSNMNERLFRERRHMTPIETRTARLDSFRLCFTVVGGRRPGVSAPANIKPAPGAAVHGVLYLLPLRKFARLDASEGRQYAYLEVAVVDASGVKVQVCPRRAGGRRLRALPPFLSDSDPRGGTRVRVHARPRGFRRDGRDPPHFLPRAASASPDRFRRLTPEAPQHVPGRRFRRVRVTRRARASGDCHCVRNRKEAMRLQVLDRLRRGPDAALALHQYRSLVSGYDAACRWLGSIRRAAVAALALKPGEIVFDVGCGTGATLPLLAEAVGPDGHVVGIEQSPEMLALARSRVARLGLSRRVTFVETAAENAKLPQTADAVFFCYTHDFLQTPAALHAIFSATRPGARIAVAGMRFLPWWGAPVNLWLGLRARRYLTTFRGLREPWAPLQAYCPDLRVLRWFHLGTSYLAAGTYGGRTAAATLRSSESCRSDRRDEA